MFYDNPIFFEKNRINRVYTGGKLFAEFFGDDSTDGYFPEEWVASSVKALNKDCTNENEGISIILGEDLPLTTALEKYKVQILGTKEEIGILTKFIDSSIRLPVQAHPDKDFSAKYLNSNHGKEESWIILATRPGAKIYYGFKDGVTEKDFIDAIKRSEYDKEIMSTLLKTIDVKVGDIFYIPAKLVHAIGYGCMLLEVQEPTDFTIQPERWCGEYRLSDEEMYLNLDKNVALECFDYSMTYEAPLEPKILLKNDEILYESFIDGVITDAFSVRSITLNNGFFTLDKQCAIYVIIDGKGEITGENYKIDICRGDYFLLPANAVNKFTVNGKLKIIECFN